MVKPLQSLPLSALWKAGENIVRCGETSAMAATLWNETLLRACAWHVQCIPSETRAITETGAQRFVTPWFKHSTAPRGDRSIAADLGQLEHDLVYRSLHECGVGSCETAEVHRGRDVLLTSIRGSS